MPDIRVGFGFDAHRLAEGKKLMLGGIYIPFEKGLDGHSDADVLLHAICDALLGAAALGDLGVHFSDKDDSYRDLESSFFLDRVAGMIRDAGFMVGNIDTTVALQKPRIQPYVLKMRRHIAGVLNIDVSQVSVKATTTEGLGYEGREEGIAAYASVLITKS